MTSSVDKPEPVPGARVVAVWAAAGLLLSLAGPWLWGRIFILVLGLWAIYWLAGLLVWAVVRFRTAGLGGRAERVGYGVPGWALILFLAGPDLNRMGDAALLILRSPVYGEVIRQAEGGALPSSGTLGGASFHVDSGPPVRVAFETSGLADNWSALVHDPSHSVREARGWRRGRAGDYTASPSIKELFGGDLVACHHVWRHWYRCAFT